MDRRKTDRRTDRAGDMMALDIEAIMATLWKRRALLFVFLFVFLIPGTLYVLLKPEIYKATATLILENQSLNLTDFQDALPTQKLDTADIDTQMKILASPSLAYETLGVLNKDTKKEDEEKRYADLRRFLSNLVITSEGRSRVVSVSYKSKDPQEAADVANAHARQYVDFQIRDRREKVTEINEWINAQVKQLKEDGRKKAQATQEFRKESGIVLGKNSEDLISQQILDLTEQLVPIETEKLRLQAQADAISKQKSKDSIGEITNSDIVRQLKLQTSEAKQELESLKAKFGTGHPDYISALNRYRQASADLGRETSNLRTSVVVELDAVTQQETMIRDRLEALNQEADQLRESQVALEAMEAEETANRTLLDSFLARSEEIRTQIDLNRASARIESPAEIPVTPIGMSKILMMTLLILFSAMASVAIVLLLELVDRGIEDGEDVKKVLNLRLIGTLPKTKNPLGDAAGRKSSPYIEEIKRIYLAISSKKAPQSVLLTSAKPGEGKSTVAISLARYMASINGKILLIDADTANSAVSRKIQAGSNAGLAELLDGSADLAAVLTRTEDGMAFISSGNLIAHPVDFLASNRFEQILATLKTQFDYILISCAAVPEKTDSEVLSALTDQVVLVIEEAKVPKKTLKKVAITLRQYAKDVPAVILNKAA